MENWPYVRYLIVNTYCCSSEFGKACHIYYIVRAYNMQKHKNPCFFKGPEETSYKVLPKDNWKELVHGDSFSLLPDDLVFSVVYREKSKKEERYTCMLCM